MAGRPNPRDLISNWSGYQGSFAVKLRLAVRNGWVRVRSRSICCGHPGEPGC